MNSRLTIETIHSWYLHQQKTVTNLFQNIIKQLDRNPGIWISRCSDKEILNTAAALDNILKKAVRTDNLGQLFTRQPLFGIPCAVKDNIDAAGLETSAACKAFSHLPEHDAYAVSLIKEAGGILLGKTNMDQFATGLVGTRSDFPLPLNPFNNKYITGGSSSGSAVAVAEGVAAFSLGTDTAGSGRIPAAMNNICGFKPTRGTISNQGVLPACRSLDCVSVFANSTCDINTVLKVIQQKNPDDPYSKTMEPYIKTNPKKPVIGIPQKDQLEFFGDFESEHQWDTAAAALRGGGFVLTEIDFSPFSAAAKLLYEGPWLAERYSAIAPFIEEHEEEMNPVVRTILAGAKNYSAIDCFNAQHNLKELSLKAENTFMNIDCLLTPSYGKAYTVEDIEKEPARYNSNLGFYMNFMNLLDLTAIALPWSFLEGNVPWGLTLSAPAFHDNILLKWAEMITGLRPSDNIDIIVCGAHMRGFPLNNELLDLGAVYTATRQTAPKYRMYCITDGIIEKPGLVLDNDGRSIETERWKIPMKNIGAFLNGIPSPLGLGKIEMDNGEMITGFICEPGGLGESRDISSFGGWRNFMKNR